MANDSLQSKKPSPQIKTKGQSKVNLKNSADVTKISLPSRNQTGYVKQLRAGVDVTLELKNKDLVNQCRCLKVFLEQKNEELKKLEDVLKENNKKLLKIEFQLQDVLDTKGWLSDEPIQLYFDYSESTIIFWKNSHILSTKSSIFIVNPSVCQFVKLVDDFADFFVFKMVWVLTADCSVLWRAGITEQCVEGSHWQRVVTPSNVQVADIALGPYNLGWLIDRSNSIYFSDNYISEDCSWWQILIRNYLFENSSLCQVTSNENSVWVTNRISPFVYVNSTSLKGHHWMYAPIKNMMVPLRWRQITAEGVFEDKGSLWLLSSANDLFHLRPNSDNVNVIALPCRAEDVSCISAAPYALWLLTHAGQIYVRQGMGDQCPEGDKWRTLNLEQISDKQVTLRHVSCGCDIIWACDARGDMYMAVGSPYAIATDTFSPIWVQVEGKPLANTTFVKVFVGSETHIVWALDNKSNLYVRSGIFHDFQLGTDWVLVPGIQASIITISGSLVWALSTSGSVFCRYGITENNYIGNYWYQVPGSLYHLTASVSEGLWGVSNKSGCLVTYSQHCVLLKENERKAQAVAVGVDNDWEIL